jgi:hypothetical protein
VCYFGYLGVEIAPAKLAPSMRAAGALWAAVGDVAARHHRGGIHAAAGGKTRGLTLGSDAVVGELACAQCACDDRESLAAELQPLAHELLEAAEVRAVVLGYLWASGERTEELAVTLDALPLPTVPKRSFVLRVSRAAGPPWPTRTLAHLGRSPAPSKPAPSKRRK